MNSINRRIVLGFTGTYMLIVFVQLWTMGEGMIHYISKPAILFSLLLFFLIYSKHLSGGARIKTSLALLFSLAGDVLLMFQNQDASFFLLGLGAFLLAHIFYVWVFWEKRNTSKLIWLFTFSLLIYAMVLMYFLKDGLGSMLPAVVVYMLVILAMASGAFMRKGKVPDLSYQLVFVGALIFMLSDSLLAVNKFYHPLSFAHIGIMLTYALAQLLIVFGILEQEEK